MGSRSTRTKLKMVFVVNLAILIIAVPSYFYVESLIPEPASFQVTDLILDQTWVQVGGSVQMSVNVTNFGDETGNHSVILTIDDEPIETKTVQLSGSESATLDFTAALITEGNHTVQIGDLTGLVQATLEAPTKPAEIQVTDLGVSRTVAAVGETIIVSATATNIGDDSGSFSLDLFVNDEKRETRAIQLANRETKTVKFEVIEESEGIYHVKVGNLTKSFEITSEAQPVKPAEFQVTELLINPSLVLTDEIVDISVKVTNVGEASGNYTVNLKIDDAIRETRDITLSGGATEVVEFEVTETNPGTHTVEIDDQSGSFNVEVPVNASRDIELYSLLVSPYEVWEGETVTIKAKADNLADEQGTLQVWVMFKDEVAATEIFQLDAGATNVPIEISVTSGVPDDYPFRLINLGNQNNTLSGYFKVVPTGFHTLCVSTPYDGLTFLLDGVNLTAPYSELLESKNYTLTVPQSFFNGVAHLNFTRWSDRSRELTRTVDLSSRFSATPQYFFTGSSCPSLYTWNGTNYIYVAEVSNHGWLGYINYISNDPDWNIVYWRNNPWDYIKLDTSQLQPRNNEYYDLILTQNWDEIFYLDAAYLMVVDHPSDVDVYSTMVEQYLDPEYMGKIYTVSQDQLTPISAVNENGDDVLSLISEMDEIFTPGIDGITSPSWNNISWNRLTLDLGDLSDAEQIKLVVRGVVDWGSADDYNTWIDGFFAQPVPNGTQITPAPYMEVKDASGNWVRVQESRQFPIPPDGVPRTFVVDLTGLFPTDDYSLRISNFWNVTFDYIGVDTTLQTEVIIHRIDPEANLHQAFPTNSNSEGNFTRYGDVTELVLNKDDKFVIGRQGDEVSLKFPDDIGAPPKTMERDIFFFISLWFKDEYGNWGFGFGFTVEPLPFQDMSGFPYPPTESYPYDADHQNYISEYNTRTITIP